MDKVKLRLGNIFRMSMYRRQHYSLAMVKLKHVIFFSRVNVPESTTKRTPSMVTEVSAMLVAMMHFLNPGGAMSKTLGTKVQ